MADLKQIEKYLKQQKLPHRLINLDQKAFTVSDVKRAGIDEDEIVKTLIIKTNNGFVALAVCGKNRVDFKKVRRLFGSKSELAKPDEVLKVVGVPIGAVCPVLVGIPLYFDRKVIDLNHVHMGSGDLKHGLEMKLSDLLKALDDYKVEDLVWHMSANLFELQIMNQPNLITRLSARQVWIDEIITPTGQ